MNDRNDRRGNDPRRGPDARSHQAMPNERGRESASSRAGEDAGHGRSSGPNGYPARLESPRFGSDRFAVRPASDYGFSGDDRFSGRELRMGDDRFAVAGDFRTGHDAADHEHVPGWGGSVRNDHDLASAGRYENRWATRPDPRFVSEHGFAGPYVGRGPKGYVRSDERIREEICEMLYLQGYVDTAEVEVAVQNGEVTFTGTVQNRGDKRFIEEMAERVAGVNEIHNQIRRSRATGERDSSVDLAATHRAASPEIRTNERSESARQTRESEGQPQGNVRQDGSRAPTRH